MSTLALQKPRTVEIRLPWPPSVNHYWQHAVVRTKRGKARAVTFVSKDGKDYRQEVLAAVPMDQRQKLDGRLHVTVVARPPDRRKRDLDNIGKALFDALKAAHVYVDDCQIDYLVVERREPVEGGQVVVSIQEVAL